MSFGGVFQLAADRIEHEFRAGLIEERVEVLATVEFAQEPLAPPL
jgi:hypothetical protein